MEQRMEWMELNVHQSKTPTPDQTESSLRTWTTQQKSDYQENFAPL